MSNTNTARASILGQTVMIEDCAPECVREYRVIDARVSPTGHYVYSVRRINHSEGCLQGIRIDLDASDFFVVEVSGDVASSLRAQGFTICGDKRKSA